MFRLAASRYANDSPSAITAIDDFVKRMNLAEEVGYDQPRVIYTTSNQIPQYGWPATYHECEHVLCVTRVQARKPNRLASVKCCNKKNHKAGINIRIKGDNPIIQQYVKQC